MMMSEREGNLLGRSNWEKEKQVWGSRESFLLEFANSRINLCILIFSLLCFLSSVSLRFTREWKTNIDGKHDKWLQWFGSFSFLLPYIYISDSMLLFWWYKTDREILVSIREKEEIHRETRIGKQEMLLLIRLGKKNKNKKTKQRPRYHLPVR